jgi:hypothetical protein
VNGFYVREFQMMYAAEEAARFLHQACRGLPSLGGENTAAPADQFYTRTLEHALGYFGSRVLYPARAAVRDRGELSRTICEDFMEAAVRGHGGKIDENALQLGYMMGSDLYDSYLAGKVSRSRLRHLFLAHPEEPGRAREICWEVVGQARSGRKRPRPVRPAPAEERRTAG